MANRCIGIQRRLGEVPCREQPSHTLEPVSLNQPADEFEHGALPCWLLPLPRRLRFAFDPLREFPPAGLAVPLFEGFIGDLALDEKLRKFSALRLALEGHDASLIEQSLSEQQSRNSKVQEWGPKHEED